MGRTIRGDMAPNNKMKSLPKYRLRWYAMVVDALDTINEENDKKNNEMTITALRDFLDFFSTVGIRDAKDEEEMINDMEEDEFIAFIEHNLSKLDSMYYDYCDEYSEVWLKLAVHLSDADGAFEMEPCIANLVKAIYEFGVRNNDERACVCLGGLYYTGRIGKQDYNKAAKYYTQAISLGDFQAAENLGYIYYYGRIGKVDYEKAFKYFSLAATSGIQPRAEYKIADMYMNGFYVDAAPKHAFFIYEKVANAVEEGLKSQDFMKNTTAKEVAADIFLRMGNCYYKGKGVEIDLLKALEYYQRAEVEFFKRIMGGDFYQRTSYDSVIKHQAEVRELLQKDLPSFDWVD